MMMFFAFDFFDDVIVDFYGSEDNPSMCSMK